MDALALTKRIGANVHNHKVNNVLVPKKEVEEEEEEEDEDMDVDDRDEKMKKKNDIGGVDRSLKKAGWGCSGGGGSGSILRCCQAERCSADLSEAKQYHKRHKVCEHHAKAQVVIVAGIRQRFCQQCSRFHEVSEFDESKRSCRRRLAGHNERRRKSSSSDNPQADGITGVDRKVTAAGGGSGHDITKEVVGCGHVEDHRGRSKIIGDGGGSRQDNAPFKHFQIR